jgi:Arc/MetJ-type ribon-helix-helix transcriptional regulator
MANVAKKIVLPEDLRAFAEERVRAGAHATIEDVVREALDEKRLALLRESLDVGLSELDAGKGVEQTADELIVEACEDAGLRK